MIRELLISFMSVTFVMCMSTTKAPSHVTGTHRTHPTHEPAERENFVFKYEPHSHKMIVVEFRNGVSSCYILNMTDMERASIHTDAGIRAVELRLLSTLRFFSTTEVTKDQLPGVTVHMCGRVKHYYLQN